MAITTASPSTTDLDPARARLNAVDWVALALLVVGGLNWGSIGVFGVDLVAAIFGSMTAVSRIVYTLVGLSALYVIYLLTTLRR